MTYQAHGPFDAGGELEGEGAKKLLAQRLPMTMQLLDHACSIILWGSEAMINW